MLRQWNFQVSEMLGNPSAYLYACSVKCVSVKFQKTGKPYHVDPKHHTNISILALSLQTHYCGSLY